MYKVEIDWAPAYELLLSLNAFASKAEHKTLDLGMEWVRATQEMISPELTERIRRMVRDEEPGLHVVPLIMVAPGERTAESFLRWLGALSTGEIYDVLQPLIKDPSMLADLARGRENAVLLLSLWNEEYFRKIDPAILHGLQADACTKQELRQQMAPEELVELATEGVYYPPDAPVETILLVPQYHFRPWNIYDEFRDKRFIAYPAEALPTPPGEPSTKLMRLTRALSDENRLKILRYLAAGPQRFTDIVTFAGLSKSTVHHHLVMLRSAGLIRSSSKTVTPEMYSLRPGAIERMSESLQEFLTSSEL